MFAILAVLIASGVFNPTRYANEECTFQPNLPCTQFYVHSTPSGAALAFNITNTMGFPISIAGYSAEIDGWSTDCLLGTSCAPSPQKYLAQGDSAMLTITPLNLPYDLTPSDFAKIKATVQFRNCHSKSEFDCTNPLIGMPLYSTSGRIHLFPRGEVSAGGSQTPPSDVCNLGEETCRSNQALVCRGGGIGTTYWALKDDCQVKKMDCNYDGTVAQCVPKTQTCDEGKRECIDASSYRICTSGEWASNSCAAGTICSSGGFCVEVNPTPSECTAGELRCNIGTGNLDGCKDGKWDASEGQMCINGCDGLSNTCNSAPLLCASGQTRCNPQDNTYIQLCQNGLWVDSRACAYGCNENTNECNLAPSTCTPNQKRCVAGTYFKEEICSPDGSQWIEQDCAFGSKCLGSSCAPDSGAPDCLPQTTACGLNPYQNQVQTCIQQDQNGPWLFTYGPLEPDCSFMGLACQAGVCTPQVRPPTPPCVDGQIVRTCGPNNEQTSLTVFECRGGLPVQVEYCEGDTYCLAPIQNNEGYWVGGHCARRQ